MSELQCRHNIKTDNGIYNVVWFGSYGRTIKSNERKFQLDSNTITIPSDFYNYTNQKFSIVLSCNGPVEISLQNDSYVVNRIAIPSANNNILVNGILNKTIDYTPASSDQLITKIVINNYSNINQDMPHYINFKNYTLAKTYDGGIDGNPSYSSKSDAIVDALIQKLSILKGELWYNYSYGIPLTDKENNRSKGIYDAIILDIINSQEGVTGVTYYSSLLDRTGTNFRNQKYISFNFEASTVYNKNIKISS